MGAEHVVVTDARVVVKITINDREAVERVTGSGGDEWRLHAYALYSEEDVFSYWSYNAIANGVTSISQLDGWADMDPAAVTMVVEVMCDEVEVARSR